MWAELWHLRRLRGSESIPAPVKAVLTLLVAVLVYPVSGITAINADAVGWIKVAAGETVIGGIRGPTRHYHCDHCKSWLYTEPDGVEGFVNVRSTMFDEPRSEPPFVELYRSEALPWARTHASHSYDTFPPADQWPVLIQQFAGRKTAWAKEEFNP